MARFTFTALMNDTHGSRFFAFHDGDDMYYGGTITVEADNVNDAMNAAYAVGNRMQPDANGNDWPHIIRSLSVGDVLVLGSATAGDNPAAWSVADFGFVALDFIRIAGTSRGVTVRRLFADD